VTHDEMTEFVSQVPVLAEPAGSGGQGDHRASADRERVSLGISRG
jgi:hypothetical protein